MRFLFVESIHEFESGRRARGRVTLPGGALLPPCLIAEAIGQLAGWVAMERSEFAYRPVAGLVGECVITQRPAADATIELYVEMHTCDDDAVEYSGSASSAGRDIVTLERCGAPMLPLGDFDDPRVMKDRFTTIRSSGVPVVFDMALGETVKLERTELTDECGLAAIITPTEPGFYVDHFPRRPVFPATLLLDAEIRLASLIQSQRHGGRMPAPALIRVSDLKLRTFIQPGTTVELRTDLRAATSSSADFALSAVADGKRIASAGLSFEWR